VVTASLVAPDLACTGKQWVRVKAFINMSQMTLSQMSINETTPSPQHKLQWLSEQALNWSGLPVGHVRPTVLREGFFLITVGGGTSPPVLWFGGVSVIGFSPVAWTAPTILEAEICLRMHREIDAELRSRPGYALHVDVTIVLVHDQLCAR